MKIEREYEPFETDKVEAEALGLYKLLKSTFKKQRFSVDDIDKVGGFKNYNLEHFNFLEEHGVLVTDPGDSDLFYIAKDMPEAY